MDEEKDYAWALEAVSLGIIASIFMFNGMPLIGTVVAAVACLEDD